MKTQFSICMTCGELCGGLFMCTLCQSADKLNDENLAYNITTTESTSTVTFNQSYADEQEHQHYKYDSPHNSYKAPYRNPDERRIDYLQTLLAEAMEEIAALKRKSTDLAASIIELRNYAKRRSIHAERREKSQKQIVSKPISNKYVLNVMKEIVEHCETALEENK